ncbi:MAG: sarcosine oxidase subunit delta [Pseudomonadota bacterium]
MRLICPICGARDLREFTPRGAYVARPEPGAWNGEWNAYLHLRENPAGHSEELWHHSHGCRSWLKVTRDTTTHEVLSVTLAREVHNAD